VSSPEPRTGIEVEPWPRDGLEVERVGGLASEPGLGDGFEVEPGSGTVTSRGGVEPEADAGSAVQLGALDGSGLLSLASLDDGAPAATGAARPAAADAFAPPEDAVPASIGPRALRPSARPARPRDEPVDLFAPPDASAAEPTVELADDELARRARKRMTAPPEPAAVQLAPGVPVAPALVAPRSAPLLDSGPAGSAGGGVATRAPAPIVAPAQPTAAPTGTAAGSAAPVTMTWLADPRARLAASPRARLAVGVLLAVVLGFIPADIIASLRERSAFRAIDARVAAVQDAADSQDSYDALDAFRAEQLQAKRSKRRMVALTSMLIWGAASGALGYVWFWRIRWERVGPELGTRTPG
jgi:hypothetical protein